MWKHHQRVRHSLSNDRQEETRALSEMCQGVNQDDEVGNQGMDEVFEGVGEVNIFSKYHSRQASCRRGHVHQSKKEALRCTDLSLMEDAKVIKNLQFQVPFVLINSFTYDKKKIRKVEYYADFTYVEKGIFTIEDCKGYRTEVYKIKRKLLLELLVEKFGEQWKFIET